MIPSQHARALSAIYDGLRRSEVIWAITGSLGFSIQGLHLGVDDIDIQTDASGAYEIEKVFAENIVREVRFSKSDTIASHWGELNIDGVKVEIMGALQKKLPDGTWESPVDVGRHRKFVRFEGMKLPVLSLAYEEQAYRILGRTEQADRIREWLTRC